MWDVGCWMWSSFGNRGIRKLLREDGYSIRLAKSILTVAMGVDEEAALASSLSDLGVGSICKLRSKSKCQFSLLTQSHRRGFACTSLTGQVSAKRV